MTGAARAARQRPLSVGQQALWLLYRLAPDSAAYNVTLAVRIRGGLDVARLARAVQHLTARHDVLRSAFAEAGGMPVRFVDTRGSVGLEVRDVPGLPTERLHALAHEVSVAPFDLSGGAPARVVLLRRDPADAVLVLAAHHLVTDAVSQWLLLRDLLTAYQCDRPLPGLPGGYDDYVAAEARLLDSARGRRMARYWEQACAGVPAARLHPDRPPSGTSGRAGESCTVRLPGGFAPRLAAASSAAGVTPFAYLLGAFQSVVHRYTGQDEFLIGTPVALRLSPSLRDVAGYLVNTLPLRASFDRSTTFAGAVAGTRARLAEGMAAAGYPLALLAGTGDAPDRPPLFRIACTMVATDRLDPPLPMVADGETEGAPVDYAGLRLALVDVRQQEGQFDLSVELRHGGGEVTGVFRYDTALFDRPTIQRFAGAFRRFAELAVAEPGGRVDAAPLVRADERDRLLALGYG